MKNTFYLEILSPERQFFAGNVETMIFPAIDGLHGVLPNHEPMITALSAGELKFKVDDQWQYAAVSNGFVEIMPSYVVLLADSIERPEEIDIKRAEIAKEREEERLRQQKSKIEYYQTQAALSRAAARLKVSKHL